MLKNGIKRQTRNKYALEQKRGDWDFPANMGHGEERKCDTKAVKLRLNEYRECERDIENQLERLNRLETKLYSVGSPTLSDMPKSPSPSNDRIADMIGQKKELEEEIKALVQQHKSERKKINAVLRKLKSSNERAVIQMRYLDVASWNDVLDMLFGGEKDFLGKEDSYMRRVHKIHSQALFNMTIIIQGGKQNE